MYVHGHALFICQLPNCNLFTQHAVYLMGETPLVNCGPRSNSLYWNTIYCNTVLLFSANNHLPHNTVNPLLQQAGEIDNLTVSLGQSTLVVLCRFHVGAGIPGVAPHYIPPPSTFNVLLGSSWFDKPWFLSEGKLAAVRIIPSSWGSQRTCELYAIKPLLILVLCFVVPSEASNRRLILDLDFCAETDFYLSRIWAVFSVGNSENMPIYVRVPQICTQLSLVLSFLIWATEVFIRNSSLRTVLFWQILPFISHCLFCYVGWISLFH